MERNPFRLTRNPECSKRAEGTRSIGNAATIAVQALLGIESAGLKIGDDTMLNSVLDDISRNAEKRRLERLEAVQIVALEDFQKPPRGVAGVFNVLLLQREEVATISADFRMGPASWPRRTSGLPCSPALDSM